MSGGGTLLSPGADSISFSDLPGVVSGVVVDLSVCGAQRRTAPFEQESFSGFEGIIGSTCS